MMDLNSIKFERTVWAEKNLAKLCPGNNIKKFTELLSTDDTEKQFAIMQDMIIIMHDAYERKMKFLGEDYEPIKVTKDLLDQLTEEELSALAVRAFADFKADGEVTVEAEPIKKEKAEVQEEST